MSSANRAGFTLLEAAVATAIVSLVAVGALTSLGAELRGAERAQRAVVAEALAEHRLATLTLAAPDELRFLPDSLANGEFAPPFEFYRWEASAEPVRGEEDLVDVIVRIEWDGGATALATRLYRSLPGLGER